MKTQNTLPTKLQANKFVPAFVLVFLTIALFAYYATAYKYHFYWQEQNQIFLNSSAWISTYFSMPAWLACLIGDYLTQFFCYPLIGGAILSILIAACVASVWKVLKDVLPTWLCIIFTVAFAVWMVMCSFPSTSRLAFFVSMAVSSIIAVSCRKLKIFAALLVPLVYWTFGVGAFLFGALISVALFRSSKRAAISVIFFTLSLVAVMTRIYTLPFDKACLYPGVPTASKPDKVHEQTLGVDIEYYLGNLDKSKQLALAAESPNSVTAFYYYLASALQDSLPDNLLKYPVKELATLTVIDDKSSVHIINMMNDLYYELGDMTYSERAAMMRNVFSPQNRNVRMIKRLAQVNLVTGQTDAANKYLRILSKTSVYDKWAQDHNPELPSKEVALDIDKRRKLMNHTDTLRLGDNCRTILLELLETNPDNKVARDYLLCTDLLLKEMDTFKHDFDTYHEKDVPAKSLYQQAMMIYLAGTSATEEQWMEYVFSPDIVDRFNQYSARRGDKHFADTYWYYFDTHK